MKYEALLRGKHRLLGVAAFSLFLMLAALIGWQWMNIPQTDLTTPVSAQTDMMLERRIAQVEQRFYYIETRLNQLENQSRYPGILPGATSPSQAQLSQMQTALDALRVQIDSPRGRVGEVECGLLKVDERTLTPAARQARRQSASGSTEPCRADPNAPVRLSVRP